MGRWGLLAWGGNGVFIGCNVPPVRCSSWGVLVCVCVAEEGGGDRVFRGCNVPLALCSSSSTES